MIAKYKNKTNVGIGFGILLMLAPALATINDTGGGGRPISPGLLGVAVAVRLAGYALFVYGCWNYALGKGYPGTWGLLGLLSCLGLLILVLFPDKRKDGIEPTVRGFEVTPVGSPQAPPPASGYRPPPPGGV